MRIPRKSYAMAGLDGIEGRLKGQGVDPKTATAIASVLRDILRKQNQDEQMNYEAIEKGVVAGHTHDGAGSESTIVGGVAEGGGSVAIATGLRSVALGDTAAATNLATLAIIYGARAQGQYCIAIGFNTLASVQRGVCIGPFSSIGARSTVALGDGAQCFGAASEYAIAIGYNSRVDHGWAVAIGWTAVTKKNFEIALGTSDHIVKSRGDREVGVQTRTATATLGATGTQGEIVIVNNAAAITLTLPTIAAIDVGRTYTIKKISGVLLDVTVSGGPGTIDGAASVVLTTQWQRVTVVATAVDVWHIIG